MSQTKLTIGVIFGSRSVEHDVSIVTATQVMKALNPAKYNIVPIYISREGRWFTGDNLNQLRNFNVNDISELNGTTETTLSSSVAYQGIITPPLGKRLSKNQLTQLDVLFPVVHGSHGEDGTLQGLFELVNLPYVGTHVLSSAIANDKGMTKLILKAHGLPVIDPSITFSRHTWTEKRDTLLTQIENDITYPVFVKPLTLGSSIGIAKAENADDAAIYIDIALNMDTHVMVEKGIVGDDIIEINCAVMGNDDVQASTLEQPTGYEELQDFEAKYLRQGGKGMKGQERIIPAPISDSMTEAIQQAAINAFKAIRGHGTARIDVLANPTTGEFWLNEINTMPGSLAFYLWEPQGMSAAQVCDELIRLAKEAHAEKLQTTFDYKSPLIELAATRGTKGKL